MGHDRRRVQLIRVINDCYDYACSICQQIYPFYDQALDCFLRHRLERAAVSSRRKRNGSSERR